MSASLFRVHEIDTRWNRSCTRSRPVVREPLVRAGIAAFAFALAVPFVGPSHETAPRPVTVASAFEVESFQGIARGPRPIQDLSQPEAVAGAMTGPVIDRGTSVAGRTLDLSYATKLVLACPDLCTLSMRLGQ